MSGQPVLGGGLPTPVLSKLGHELRGPLAGITSLTKIMLTKVAAGTADPATQQRQLELIRTSAAELLDTVERTVEIVKLDATPATPTTNTFDSRGVVTDLAAAMEPAATARGRHLTVDLPADPIMVAGDPATLRRILTELVDNAIKYTDTPSIQIQAVRAGRGAVLQVSNTGPTIAPDEQSRILEPFERGSAADRAEAAGSGLGLYLARRLAQHLGAELTLHSDPSSGTTFAVRLAS